MPGSLTGKPGVVTSTSQGIGEAVAPLRRQADAREVAEAFRYLASSASSYVTGAWLDVNDDVVLL